MKTTCTRENLKKALNLTSRVVGGSSALPILNNLLLKTETGQLAISSTNLEIATRARVGGQIDEQGELTVPAKTLADFVNNMADERISLETRGNDLLIKTDSSESVLKGLPAEEFPLIPEIKPTAATAMKSAILGEGLSQVAFATAVSETQPELAGVLFHFEGKELRLAATDRYRLAERVLETDRAVKQVIKIIVPNRAVSELGRILSLDNGTVEIQISENQILFQTTGAELISRLIEGQYVPYQEIVPKTFSTNIVVSTEEFISAIKLSGLFVADSNNIDLEISRDNQNITIRSSSQKFGTNTTHTKAEVEGENNRIVFNYRYVLDCLTRLNSEKTVLKVVNSSSPAMLGPWKKEGYLYLVMPIKV